MNALEIELIHVPTAERAGIARRGLARAAAIGRLHRVCDGVYVEGTSWDPMTPVERHVVLMRALQLRSADPIVFSHWSAAVLLGLPPLDASLALVYRTVPRGPLPNRPGVRAHPLSLDGKDIVTHGGLLCTGMARTAVDLAASLPFRQGVCIADAALAAMMRSGGGEEDLRSAWMRAQPRRATRKVGQVIDFAHGLSGSPGESESRVSMLELGLPAPVLQHRFSDAQGFVAEVDFWFPHLGVVGEFDGRIKYFDPKLTGGDTARVLYEEKLREDRLRALVAAVVRWGWREAHDAALLRPRLAAVGVLPR